MIKSAQLLLLYSPEAQREMTIRISRTMGPMFLLLIVCGCCLAEGIPSTELKQMNEIVKRLEAKIENQEARIKNQEAKIEKQDTLIDELQSTVRRNMSELAERMEAKADKTAKTLEAIRDREHLSASGNKAVRDLPYIMMCAYQSRWSDTGIIPYEKLTLDYSNCDRPGETL